MEPTKVKGDVISAPEGKIGPKTNGGYTAIGAPDPKTHSWP